MLNCSFLDVFFKHANEKNTQLWYYMCEDSGFAIARARPHTNQKLKSGGIIILLFYPRDDKRYWKTRQKLQTTVDPW